MEGMVKTAAADALAQLAARVILDMAPYIEEFMVNDLAPMLMDGVGAVGDFLAGVADSLHPDEMSPAIASTLPPKLPRSGFAENFSIGAMTASIRSASKAYYEDRGNPSKRKAFVESMALATKFIQEAKVLLTDRPEGLTASLQDYADLFELATEVSRFRNVRNFNETLAQEGEPFSRELFDDFADAIVEDAIVKIKGKFEHGDRGNQIVAYEVEQIELNEEDARRRLDNYKKMAAE